MFLWDVFRRGFDSFPPCKSQLCRLDARLRRLTCRNGSANCSSNVAFKGVVPVSGLSRLCETNVFQRTKSSVVPERLGPWARPLSHGCVL